MQQANVSKLFFLFIFLHLFELVLSVWLLPVMGAVTYVNKLHDSHIVALYIKICLYFIYNIVLF
jgi:hypothetical protein